MIVDLTSDDEDAGANAFEVIAGPPQQPSMSASFVGSGSGSNGEPRSSKDKLDSYLLGQELNGMIDNEIVTQVRAETHRRNTEQRFSKLVNANGNGRRVMPGSVGGGLLGGRRLPASFSSNHGTSALSKQASSSSSSSSFSSSLNKSNVPVPVQLQKGNFQSTNREAFLQARNKNHSAAPGGDGSGWLESHNNMSMARPATNVGLTNPDRLASNGPVPKMVLDAAYVNSGAYLSNNVGLSLSSNTGLPFSAPPVYVPLATISFFLVNLYKFTIRSDYGSIPDIKSLMHGLIRLKGFYFDDKKFQMVFDLNSYSNVENLVKEQKVNIEGIPRDIIASAMMRRENESQTDTRQLRKQKAIDQLLLNEYKLSKSKKLMDALAPFQRKGVHFICDKDRNNGRALLADEMGLGKTRQAIGVMACYQNEWPVLVICPSSAKYHWKEEIMSLLQDDYLQPKDITIIESGSHPIGTPGHCNYKVVIISYNLLHNMYDQLKTMKFGFFVADECHIVKNSKAMRTKALKNLSQSISRCLFMSGTPATNRPEELFSVLHMINPKNRAWRDEAAFKKRYCKQQQEKGKRVKSGQEFKGASNTHELHLILTHPNSGVMIRRMKKDILKSLKSKQRSIVNVAVMNDEKREELRNIYIEIKRREQDAYDRKKEKDKLKQFKRLGRVDHLNSSNNNVEVDEDLDRTDRRNLLMKLFVETGKAKVDAVKSHIDAFFANMANGKLLIFAHHKVVLDEISKHLKKKSIDYIRIDGRVKASTRFEYVNRFQNNSDCRAAVLGITAAGVALTLTAANNVFFAELYWTPGSLIQAEDRSHRIGQAQTVNVRYFLANGTVDELLWPLVKKKLSKLGEICDGEMNNQLNAKVHAGSIVNAGTDVDGGIFGSAPASASMSSTLASKKEKKETSGDTEKEAAPVVADKKNNLFMQTVMTSSATKRRRLIISFDSDDEDEPTYTGATTASSGAALSTTQQNSSSSSSAAADLKEGSSSSTSNATVGKIEETIADEALLFDMAQVEAAEERNAVSPKKGQNGDDGDGDDGDGDEQDDEDARQVNYGYDSDSSKKSNEDEDEEVEGLAADALITYYFNNLTDMQNAVRLAAKREENKDNNKSPYTSSSHSHKLQKLDGDSLHFDFTKENTNPSPSRGPTRNNTIILLDSDSDDDVQFSAQKEPAVKVESKPSIVAAPVEGNVKAENDMDVAEAIDVDAVKSEDVTVKAVNVEAALEASTSNGTTITQQAAASHGNGDDSDSDETAISLDFN